MLSLEELEQRKSVLVEAELRTAKREQSATAAELRSVESALATARSELVKMASKLQTAELRKAELTRIAENQRRNLVATNKEVNQLKEQLARVTKYQVTTSNNPLFSTLTPQEVTVIRKAMAKIHHPDIGGDTKRMARWNAYLDSCEK